METQTLYMVWTVVASVITAATILLHAIAPLTKNTKDDSILKILEKIVEVLSLNKKLE